MKKILVPTDFSSFAMAATKAAITIAKKAKSEIILLHVIEQANSGSFNVEGEVSSDAGWENKLFTMKLIEKSRKQLSEVADLVRKADVAVHQELRLGDPFHGIHTIITEHDVDLVIMGTEGHSKLDRMLIGSTTEKVVRQAKCPVLTIHESLPTSDFKNIVYATSMIKTEDSFSSVVVKLQDLFNATLHIVWVNTPALFEPEMVVKRALLDFAGRLKLKNYTLNVYSDYSEEEGILHFAESINANLIMMSTHGRKGLAHVLSGSIAEGVTNKTRRPVLTGVIK